MSKKAVLFFLFFSLLFSSYSQILEPISWEFKVDSSNYSDSEKLDLIFEPTTEVGWYIYSSDNDPEAGPYTMFDFDENATYSLDENIKVKNVKTKFDSVWLADVRYLDNGGAFIQSIIKNNNNLSVNGFISYQVCSEIQKMCIPLETDFSFFKKIDSKEVLSVDYLNVKENESLLSFVLFSFLAGFLAILTPCVFPMIPITVSFFANKTQKNSTLDALIYGLSIIIIFTFFGVFLSLLMGPQTANDIATGLVPNIIFFVLFLIFGASLIGFFELTLPSGIITSIDKKSDQGGFIGLFFMALTLVLVSFSCTGPLVGSILVQSASGLKIQPVLGMLAFSTAFATPFTLLAIFPDKLKSLPKSGGWMITLRVILGFIAIIFSFKFLGVVDKAYHFNLLSRDIILVIWSALLFILALYVFGMIKLPEGYNLNKGIVNTMLGVSTLLLSLTLLSGIFGNRLTYLAAYLPPQSPTYVDIKTFKRTPFFLDYLENDTLYDNIKFADIFELPHGLKGFFDFDEGMSYAKEVNKPVLLDFTGHGCVNCRDIEARVWPDQRVRDILNNDYVLVSLYVDDKTVLSEENWYVSSYDGKVKKSIGRQNSDFQISRFQNNAQPYYVVINPFSDQIISPPWGYELNIEKYINNLKKGIDAFYKN